MDIYDIDLTGTDPGLVYDWQDFETRDALDAEDPIDLREIVYGLPARPGVRR